MSEDLWKLIATCLSENATQGQQNDLNNWLEKNPQHYEIWAAAKVIWSAKRVQTVDFDSQKASEKLYVDY